MPKVEGIASVNIDRYVHLLTQLLEYFIKGYRTHYDTLLFLRLQSCEVDPLVFVQVIFFN